jgi:O-antigen ligase
MSATPGEAAGTPSRRKDLLWMGVILLSCVAAGWLIPEVGYFLPMLLALAVFGFFGAAILFTIFGMEGGLLVGAAVTAFFLMQRFDENLAIPLGEFQFRGMYLAATLQVGMLFLVVTMRKFSDTTAGREGGVFASRFMGLWAAFFFSCAFTVIVNNLLGYHLQHRNIIGEALATYAILLPMVFVPLALSGSISHRRTILCLHALVGLGGLAGFILSAFGILPGQLLGALGWQGTIQGTTDLVRGRLPLGHPNHVAAVINMLLPIAVVYGFLGKGWHWRVFHLGCALFMLCGVLFALSRGALLNLAIVLCITLAYVFLTRDNRRWYTPFLLAAALCVAITVPLILFQTYDFSRFWSRGYYEDTSVERRADSMRTALAVWWDHPFRGVSPDAVYPRLELRHDFEPEFSDSISPIFYYKGMPTAETPHNLFLIVPAELGFFGAALFFGLLGYMGAVFLRARRLPGMEKMDRQLITAFAISLGATLLSGMFEAILFAGMRTNVIFWVLMAVAFVYTFQAIERRTAR